MSLPSRNSNISSYNLTRKHTQTCHLPCYTAEIVHQQPTSPWLIPWVTASETNNFPLSRQLHFPQLHKRPDSQQRHEDITDFWLPSTHKVIKGCTQESKCGRKVSKNKETVIVNVTDINLCQKVTKKGKGITSELELPHAEVNYS